MQHRGDSSTAPKELLHLSISQPPGEFHQLEWWEMMELVTQETEATPVPSQGMLSHLLEDGWVLVGCSTGRFMHRPTCKWFIFLLRSWNLTHQAPWPRLVINSPVGFALVGSPCVVFHCLTPEQLLAFPSEPWKKQNVNRK